MLIYTMTRINGVTEIKYLRGGKVVKANAMPMQGKSNEVGRIGKERVFAACERGSGAAGNI